MKMFRGRHNLVQGRKFCHSVGKQVTSTQTYKQHLTSEEEKYDTTFSPKGRLQEVTEHLAPWQQLVWTRKSQLLSSEASLCCCQTDSWADDFLSLHHNVLRDFVDIDILDFWHIAAYVAYISRPLNTLAAVRPAGVHAGVLWHHLVWRHLVLLSGRGVTGHWWTTAVHRAAQTYLATCEHLSKMKQK